MERKFSRFGVGFLTLGAFAHSAFATQPKAQNALEESDEEQMVTQVEQMGKSIQQALSKIATQFKSGNQDSAAAKVDLEKLAADIGKTQAAMKNNQKGREPAAPAKNQEMMKTLQNFIQNLSTKMLDNVNQTVDKLEKMGDEGQ